MVQETRGPSTPRGVIAAPPPGRDLPFLRSEDHALRSVQSTRGGTPGAKRLDSDAECRENIGEELHSHFNYEWDSLSGVPRSGRSGRTPRS
jgi:hypothetical protein